MKSRTSSRFGIFALLLVIALMGVAAYGWVFNIVKLMGVVSDPLTGMFILRCVGVAVAPLGVVLGYF